ncbi:WD40 repeat domain-containing protein [Catenulispora rubra]|uniref:WD40 repeat domain-containing protein n=1 Tax=Catenulispora rubra TaxID=280293 RepID=UPI0018925AB7|nr:hypothetical protein [Catenulispora rubra]
MVRISGLRGRTLAAGLTVVALAAAAVAIVVTGHSAGRGTSGPASGSEKPATVAAVSTTISPSTVARATANGTVAALTYSPDGKTLADILNNDKVELRDAATGTVSATLEPAPQNPQPINALALAFSPDGRTLAVGYQQTEAREEVTEIGFVDPATRTVTGSFPLTTNGVRSLAYSPDGKTLAVAGLKNFVLMDTATHASVYVADDQAEFGGDARFVTYSGNGTTLAVADNNGVAKLWDVRSMRITRTLTIVPTLPNGTTGLNAYVSSASFDSDGSHLLLAGQITEYPSFGSSADTTSNYPVTYPAAWLWDSSTETFTELGVNLSDSNRNNYLGTFSPAGNLMAVANEDEGLALLDPHTRKTAAFLYPQAGTAVSSIAFSPNGRFLALTTPEPALTGSGGAANTSLIELWSIYSIERLVPTPCAGNTGNTESAKSATSPALAYSVGSAVYLRCGDDAPSSLAPALAGDHPVTDLVWSPDGTQLAWLTSDAVEVFQPASHVLRVFGCPGCAGIAFVGGHAASVAAADAGGQQGTATPRLIVFPASGLGAPASRPVTGIPSIGIDTDFLLLGAVSPTGLVVSYGNAGGSDGGGPQVLYRVNAEFQATELGNADLSRSTPQTQSQIDGALRLYGSDPTGRRLAFSQYLRAGACGGMETAVVVDATTGAVALPQVPTGGGPYGYWTEGLWFDTSGTAYASLTPNASSCPGAIPNQPTPSPSASASASASASIAPIVCRLQSGHWVSIGTGILQADYGPDGWVAQRVGTVDVYSRTATMTSTTLVHGAQTVTTLPATDDVVWAPAGG